MWTKLSHIGVVKSGVLQKLRRKPANRCRARSAIPGKWQFFFVLLLFCKRKPRIPKSGARLYVDTQKLWSMLFLVCGINRIWDLGSALCGESSILCTYMQLFVISSKSCAIQTISLRSFCGQADFHWFVSILWSRWLCAMSIICTVSGPLQPESLLVQRERVNNFCVVPQAGLLCRIHLLTSFSYCTACSKSRGKPWIKIAFAAGTAFVSKSFKISITRSCTTKPLYKTVSSALSATYHGNLLNGKLMDILGNFPSSFRWFSGLIPQNLTHAKVWYTILDAKPVTHTGLSGSWTACKCWIDGMVSALLWINPPKTNTMGSSNLFTHFKSTSLKCSFISSWIKQKFTETGIQVVRVQHFCYRMYDRHIRFRF